MVDDITKSSVLVVDDNVTNLSVMVDYLTTAGFEIFAAEDGESAIELLDYVTPDIILLDVMMPGMDGFETCQRMKHLPQVKDTPIIFMTALSDTDDKVKGFQAGAVDYVTKPIQHEELLARLQTHLTIQSLRKQLLQNNSTLEQRINERTEDLTAVAKENERLLEESQKLVQQLQEVDRAKSQFITMISHELRTPLNAVNGFAELLLMGISGELPEAIEEDVQLIYNNGQHLLRLINDLIDISQIDTGRIQISPERVVVSELISTILADIASLQRTNYVKIEADIAPDLPPIFADPTRTKQILLNLLGNAIKFTPEGSITILAEPTPQDMMRFAVRDTGIGIPPAKQAQIFNRFQQVDMADNRAYGGLGIGLSICQELVVLQGGEIGVTSELGQGSEFYFTLPLAIGDA